MLKDKYTDKEISTMFNTGIEVEKMISELTESFKNRLLKSPVGIVYQIYGEYLQKEFELIEKEQELKAGGKNEV